jgi:tetrahydromethanopterin S-methyltransferase subunit G
MGDTNAGYPYPPPSGGNAGQKIAILFGAVVALLAANIYLYFQLEGVREDITAMRKSVAQEVATVRETSAVTAQAQRRTVDSLRDQLDAAQRQAAMAAGQAKTDATRRAEELAAKLLAAQEQQKALVQKQLTDVKAAAAATDTRVSEVRTEVAKVDTKVDTAKSEIDKTISDLKSVRGDMGVQSGLIATNSKELAALRALGERNYFEFNLAKTKQPQRIGDIMVQLKRADQKKNRYTIEITADDKRTEKKDKSINEPVQFYVAAARQPYELVVNSVGKDLIVGYLATPKVREPRK